MSLPIAAIISTPPRTPGGGEGAPVPASTVASEAGADTPPIERELGFDQETAGIGSNAPVAAPVAEVAAPVAENQGEKMKEKEQKAEDQSKIIVDLQRNIALLLESAKNTEEDRDKQMKDLMARDKKMQERIDQLQQTLIQVVDNAEASTMRMNIGKAASKIQHFQL